MAKNSMTFPCRFIAYVYSDVPKEFHIVCLETGSFGVGRTLPDSIKSLSKSISAQLEHNLNSGAPLFGALDEEWESAFKEGKISHVERAVIIAKGHCEIELEIERSSVRAEIDKPLRADTAAVLC